MYLDPFKESSIKLLMLLGEDSTSINKANVECLTDKAIKNYKYLLSEFVLIKVFLITYIVIISFLITYILFTVDPRFPVLEDLTYESDVTY